MKMPLMLDVKDKQVLVIGGGPIGFRKAMKFLEYGANVTCISLDFIDDFNQTEIVCIHKPYHKKQLSDFEWIVAACDISLNGEIYRDAKQLNKLCMTVDRMQPSDFSFMAIREQRGLTLAVSTQGGSPSFSKEMVEKLMLSVTSDELDRLEDMVKKRREYLNSLD